MIVLGELQVGAELAGVHRATGFQYWNRYAAVNNEYFDIHMDDEAGRAAGYPTAFGMGNLTWAYLHASLRGWFGVEATIEEVDVQFRGAVTRNNEISVRGTVTGILTDESGTRISLDLLATNAQGDRLAPGRAVVWVREEG